MMIVKIKRTRNSENNFLSTNYEKDQAQNLPFFFISLSNQNESKIEFHGFLYILNKFCLVRTQIMI